MEIKMDFYQAVCTGFFFEGGGGGIKKGKVGHFNFILRYMNLPIQKHVFVTIGESAYVD